MNAVWLWGFGVVPARAPALEVAGWELRAADPWLRALWQGQGGRVSTPAWPLAAVEGATLLALDEPPAAVATESLLWVERELLQPLAAGLRDGAIARVELLLGDTEWLVRAGDRWRFWRRPARLEVLAGMTPPVRRILRRTAARRAAGHAAGKPASGAASRVRRARAGQCQPTSTCGSTSCCR